MNVTCIFFGVIFTIAGFMFACGKGHIHLSSWKNMTQEGPRLCGPFRCLSIRSAFTAVNSSE